jgi:hypothetical protein
MRGNRGFPNSNNYHVFLDNTPDLNLKILMFSVASDHSKESGAADAFENIAKKSDFNHLIYIQENKIHFLVHRFRGRSLPEKALNNQGGINIGSTPGKAMTGRLFGTPI